ncbi:MAG: 4Fe-4S binding protein [Chloroflexi bacterium]|jgi:Fe-S-cluster-containing dehydrogenase component|nr:4Fe-4S binding protein [Chloroflexota bacterium]
MSKYGLLIDYEYCTGCHTCEIACKQEHELPVGQWGIKISQSGPMRYADDKWTFDYIPVPTDLCDLCRDRITEGLQPSCVKHCQAGVMKYGTIKELAKYMEFKSKTVLFVPEVAQ